MVLVTVLTIAAVILLANGWVSLRLAYDHERHLNGGGYPILGHVVMTFFVGVLVALLLPALPEARTLPQIVRWILLAFIVGLPILHYWAIQRAICAGTYDRESAANQDAP